MTREIKELEGKGEKRKLKEAQSKYDRLNVKRTSLEQGKDKGIILQET